MFYDPQLRLCDECQAGEIMHKILVGPWNCLSIAQLAKNIPDGKLPLLMIYILSSFVDASIIITSSLSKIVRPLHNSSAYACSECCTHVLYIKTCVKVPCMRSHKKM